MKAYKHLPCGSRIPISARVYMAGDFFARFSGLIFRERLDHDEVFILKGCKSIHTIGMRYIIDAAFLDGEGKIVKLVKQLKPWRVTPYFHKAVSVMEARAGFLNRWSLEVGDSIIYK